MSQTTERPRDPSGEKVDRAQFVLAGVLVAVGVYTIVDARGLTVGFGDPVGPAVFPYLIGTGMVVLAVLLAVATARETSRRPRRVRTSTSPPGRLGHRRQAGRRPRAQPAAGEPARLGRHRRAALRRRRVGARQPHLVRDVLVGAVLSVGSWYFFYALGVPLDPGILDGIL